MPTAGKLIAGLSLALTAAIAAYVFVGLHPDMQIGFRFIAGNFAVGFFCGWYSLGRNPGFGIIGAAFSGLRTLVLLLIGSGLVFAGVDVLTDLNRPGLDDPLDVPLIWIQTSFDYVVLALEQKVLVVLAIGGVLSGIASYQASIHWR